MLHFHWVGLGLIATEQPISDTTCIHFAFHFHKQDSHAVTRKPHDAAAVLFGLKFANNIHYKFKSSQASKARFQSFKHSGGKENLMQNGHSTSFKVTCFGDKVLNNAKY